MTGNDHEDDAARARREWEARARSPWRDFFVASLPFWHEGEDWTRQAEYDAALITMRLPWDEDGAVGGRALADLEVLEIGCGVGRLARPLARRVRAYTGIDVSETMVAAAREGAGPNERFFVSDGAGIPAAARDRAYDLVVIWAVFIHCPRTLCASLLAAAREVLAPGGQVRVQLAADPADPTPTPETVAVALPVALPASSVAVAATRDLLDLRRFEGLIDHAALSLVEGTTYKGHAFSMADARALFEEAGFTDILLLRAGAGEIGAAARR